MAPESAGPSLAWLGIPFVLICWALLWLSLGYETGKGRKPQSPSQTVKTERRKIIPGELNENSRLTLRSVGPVVVGMSIDEAAAAIGRRLIRSDNAGDSDSCYYAVPENGPAGVSFMVSGGIIVRIDITGSSIATLSGIRIGDSEQQVLSRYRDRITVRPNHYEQNENDLVFLPEDGEDKDYRMIFFTEKGTVDKIVAGRLPEVQAVEGCL